MSSAKRHEAPTTNLDTPGRAEKLKAVLAGQLCDRCFYRYGGLAVFPREARLEPSELDFRLAG
jgi:hypothetical protein